MNNEIKRAQNHTFWCYDFKLQHSTSVKIVMADFLFDCVNIYWMFCFLYVLLKR